MADLGGEQANQQLKKALQWTLEEVDRLCISWCAVSTAKGGPGANQRSDGMWKLIAENYHRALPPAPVPRDSDGNECQTRTQSAMETKWKRTRPLIAKYMKCVMLAENFPVSGENEIGFLKRVMDAYKKEEKNAVFPFVDTYNNIKDNPKFRVDVAQLVRGLEQETGASRRCMVELLEREKVSAPSVASTGKPEGIKKARRTTAEVAALEKEIAKEEGRLEVAIEDLTHRGKNFVTALAQSVVKSQALQSQVDVHIMSVDTTGMEPDMVEYYTLMKRAALHHARQWEAERVAERNSAREGILASEAALAAEAERARRAQVEDSGEEERGEEGRRGEGEEGGEERELVDSDEEFYRRVNSEE